MDDLTPRRGRVSLGPGQVRAIDRTLLEWVADASPGDRVPEPWRWARSPTRSVILSLVDLGVIPRPDPGTDMSALLAAASTAARAWLDAHPEQPGSAPAVE
jgi:hypothetical protein